MEKIVNIIILSIFIFSFFITACGGTYNHSTSQWEYNPECVSKRKNEHDPQYSTEKLTLVSDQNSKVNKLHITGKIICAQDPIEFPIIGARVDLFLIGKTIATAQTNTEGVFNLFVDQEISNNVSTVVKAETKCGTYQKIISNYEDGIVQLNSIHLK